MLSYNDIISRRRIVIHHTHLLYDKIIILLKPNDIVFFDDCLFSQYVFISEKEKLLKNLNVDCILGFSTALYAAEDAIQIKNVESHVLHDACNSKIFTIDDADALRSTFPEMNGFMKVSQLKQLLQMPFCHLALHGCCHLNLSKEKNLLKKVQLFKNDLDAGCNRLKQLELSTNMFVYPYVHSFPISDICLKKRGFACIIGSNQIFRTSIEDLSLEVSKICDGTIFFSRKSSKIKNK